MSAQASFDTKERVRQAIDIVELVRDYLGDVQREGRNFKALCPWHEDSRPSLKINPERQSYKCWVCDVGGDVFSFVMQYENVTFPEALRSLAERAGIQLAPAAMGSSQADRGRKLTLYDVMAWAERKYHECLLRLPEGEPARKYAKSRGISQDSVVKFHLGAAPDSWSWLQGHARREGIDFNLLSEAGVLGRREGSGSYYDRFNGRLMFSIRDPQGRPVAFGGRILPEFKDQSAAKYINSPETPLFSKHKLLYGLDMARDAIRQGKTALVMEGYTDCLLAHQLGIRHAVAVLGTSLGETHVRDLGRMADQIILVLDGDEAGRRRANEVLELFVAQQVDLRILTLPDDLDPCDFLLQRGAEQFTSLLAGAVDALEHKLRGVSGGLGLSRGTHEAHAALEEVLTTLAKAPRLDERTSDASSLRVARILSRLAHASGVDEAVLRKRLAEMRRANQRRPASQTARKPSSAAAPAPSAEGGTSFDASTERWERLLLEAVLLAADIVQKADIVQELDLLREVSASLAPGQLGSPRCRALYEHCCLLVQEGQPPTFERLMIRLEDAALKNLLVELDEASQNRTYRKQADAVQQELRDIMARFHQRDADWQQGREAARLREGQVPEDESGHVVLDIIKQQQANPRHFVEHQRAR